VSYVNIFTIDRSNSAYMHILTCHCM